MFGAVNKGNLVLSVENDFSDLDDYDYSGEHTSQLPGDDDPSVQAHTANEDRQAEEPDAEVKDEWSQQQLVVGPSRDDFAAEDQLRQIRDRLESVLRGNWNTGDPRFYYGGSFGKRTMIREAYDLDLVVYFPHDIQHSVRDFYIAVEQRLRTSQYKTVRHNVAIRLPYDGGFHVDVVPGRALANDYVYANLYASERDTTRQTSIKIHIQSIRDGGNQDIIKLMKVWRLRHQVPFGSFVLELAVAQALKGCRKTSLEDRMWDVLLYLRDKYSDARLVDPANSNNVVSDDIAPSEKYAVQSAAASSCQKKRWQEIVW